MDMCVSTMVDMWRSKNTQGKPVLSFSHVGTRHWIQVVSLAMFLCPLSNRAGPSLFSVILLASQYTVLYYRLKSPCEDSMCFTTGTAHAPSPVPSSTVTSQRQKNGDIGHQQTGTVRLSPAHRTWEPRHLPCSALVWEQWFCGPELCQLLFGAKIRLWADGNKD